MAQIPPRAASADKFSTNVTARDIVIAPDGAVAIKSLALLNTFIQSPAHAIAKITSSVAPVHPDDIEVDDSGRIIIRDPAFAAALKAKMTKGAAEDTNYLCKNAYQCKGLSTQ